MCDGSVSSAEKRRSGLLNTVFWMDVVCPLIIIMKKSSFPFMCFFPIAILPMPCHHDLSLSLSLGTDSTASLCQSAVLHLNVPRVREQMEFRRNTSTTRSGGTNPIRCGERLLPSSTHRNDEHHPSRCYLSRAVSLIFTRT